MTRGPSLTRGLVFFKPKKIYIMIYKKIKRLKRLAELPAHHQSKIDGKKELQELIIKHKGDKRILKELKALERLLNFL